MNETELNALLESLRSELSGDLTKDMLFLEKKAEEYAKQENGNQITAAIVEMAMNLMPKEHLDFMKSTIYIGERRMDMIYAEAQKLMEQKHFDKAAVLTGQIYDKVLNTFTETEDTRYFSFRNLLESNLYHLLYHPSKRLERTPFDFVRYLTAHAYNLVELNRPAAAIPVLEEAIRYNPVCPDARFELAEIHKIMSEPEKLLTVVRETIPTCTTRYALARCYANLGYYCVDKREFDKAICFYFESLVYFDSPQVRMELAHVAQLRQHKIQPPKREDVLAAFASMEIPNGPDQNVLHVAASLGQQELEKEHWAEASFYLSVFADLTNDEEAKRLFADCQEKLKAQNENR